MKKFRRTLSSTLSFLTIMLLLLSTRAGTASAYGQKKKSPYIWLLKECSQEVFLKTFEYPFLTLLDGNLNTQYENLKSLEEKKSFIHYYWKQNNPNPLEEKNEFLEKFIQRCHYVEKNFSYPQPPYFDDRGKYYLKYGEPSIRYKQAPQRKFVDFFREQIDMIGASSLNVREFLLQKISKGVEVNQYLPPDYSIRGNETWVYQFIRNNKEEELVIHFVSEGEFFREAESLDEAIIHPRKRKILYFYWADLIKARVTALQSQSIFRVYEKILAFEEEIRSVGTKGPYYRTYSSGFDMSNPDAKYMSFNTDLKVQLNHKKIDVPPTVFTTKEAVQELFFYYDIVQFRGTDNETALVINYFTPLAENFKEGNQLSESDSIGLFYSGLFEDEMLEKVMESNISNTYSIQKLSGLQLPYLIGNVKISLLPRPGRVTLQVKDAATGRKGFVKRIIQLRDFDTEELCLSDIQFCQLIEDSLYREFCPVRHTRGISVIPYPYERIKRKDPLFCYFEIYNIKTGGIQALYDISLEVKTAPQKIGLQPEAAGNHTLPENSISIHHTRSVEQDDTRELVGIDFSNLKKGHYTLTVRVTDNDNQNISAAVTRNLQIVE